jgi:dethiobiotin synthetase
MPLDALAVATACGQPDLGRAEGLYRAGPALSPYAASLVTDTPPADIGALTARIQELSDQYDVVLVEGAGGLLVPIDRHRTVADLAASLGLALLVVTRDQLGVISHTLTLFESATARGLRIAGLVLVSHEPDESSYGPGSNLQVLAELVSVPVLGLGFCEDDDDRLARAVQEAGLLGLLHKPFRSPLPV